MFRFPHQGGTGAIWKAVASLLPEKNQRYNCRVAEINADEKYVVLSDGKKIGYQKVGLT